MYFLETLFFPFIKSVYMDQTNVAPKACNLHLKTSDAINLHSSTAKPNVTTMSTYPGLRVRLKLIFNCTSDIIFAIKSYSLVKIYIVMEAGTVGMEAAAVDGVIHSACKCIANILQGSNSLLQI